MKIPGLKYGLGCLGLLFAGFVLVMVIAISNRPSPEEKAANDRRVAQLAAASVCQDAVRAGLKAPASAEFQAPRDARYSYPDTDGSFTITSHVDAQNSFGAKLRTPYTCTVAPAGVGFRVVEWKMDGAR